jgi:hypothetical protein
LWDSQRLPEKREERPMPIDYQRDDRRRLILVTLTDPFSFDELLGQTDRQWLEQTWAYAILYDARAIAHVTPAPGLQQLLDRTHSVGGGRPRGPVGVAIPQRPEMFRCGLQLAKLSGRLGYLEVLLNEAQIEAWFARNAPRRGSPGQS